MEVIKGGRQADIAFFNKEVLQNTIETKPQVDMSVIVTVPHDGINTAITRKSEEWDLPKIQPSKTRDVAVSILAKEMRQYVDSHYFKAPGLFIQKIHREHLTRQIQWYFNKRVNQALDPLRSTDALLLDLHGFTTQPEIGEFDLILGTMHRQTVKGSQIDKHFEEFMSERQYRVYRPESYPIPGELYSAEGENSLMQSVLSANSYVYGLQIEIARDFRMNSNESTQKGKQLMKDLGDYLVQWEDGLGLDIPRRKGATIYQFPTRSR